MTRFCFLFILIAFFNCCNNESANHSLCGTWYNKEEDTKIILNCDSTFIASNIPADIDNCFFNYAERTVQGKWKKFGAKQIKLSFGRSSYCFLEIVNTENVNLRMRTKIDSNQEIDFSLQK
jgi:hypothetical protein